MLIPFVSPPQPLDEAPNGILFKFLPVILSHFPRSIIQFPGTIIPLFHSSTMDALPYITRPSSSTQTSFHNSRIPTPQSHSGNCKPLWHSYLRSETADLSEDAEPFRQQNQQTCP